MKIRIISDIHRSINENYPLELEDNCDYTLIAGDLGPEFEKNAEWLRKNVKRGAFVSGNHDAYDRNITIEDAKEFYHREFPEDSDITYFDSSVGVLSKEIAPGILLVADVLYTDYALPVSGMDEGRPPDQIVKSNIRRAEPKFHGTYMNDFNYYTRDGRYASDWEKNHNYDDRYHITPHHYLRHFEKTFAEITRIIEANPDKRVILMTHHCLSPRCIGEKFSKDELNASYVSDREKWIADHPNLKLVVSGHVHNRNMFHVGDALYVLNPLGYVPYGEHLEGENGEAWTPDCFVDTETWTVSKEPYRNKEWEKRLKKDMDAWSMFG